MQFYNAQRAYASIFFSTCDEQHYLLAHVHIPPCEVFHTSLAALVEFSIEKANMTINTTSQLNHAVFAESRNGYVYPTHFT